LEQAVTPEASGAAQLTKSLRARHVAMISIGGIIGGGLFVNSMVYISDIGPAVIVSYALTGLIVLFVMRSLSEMAMAYPGVGSCTEYTRLSLGNLAGFTSGWLYWYFWVIVVAFEAIVGAKIAGQWLPGVPPWALGIAFTVLLTGSNLLSTRSYGEFEFWFSSIKVAAIIVFILIAGAFAFGLNPTGAPSFDNLWNNGGFAPKGEAAILVGVVSLIFTLVGAEITTVAAAESNASEKVIAGLTTALIVRMLLFYVLSIALIMAVVPWGEVDAQRQAAVMSPFTMALQKVGVPYAPMIMDIIVVVAVLSCLNSGIYVGSRVLFGLAHKGDAPKFLRKVDGRGVPSRAILLASAISVACVALDAFFPKELFSFLLNASGALMIFVYIGVTAAQLAMRPRIPAERLQIRAWFHPWGGYLTIAAMLAVLVAMGTKASTNPAQALSSSQIELLSSTALMAVIVLAYFVFRRGRA
jgi:L-asparagine transporter-like permease